MMRMNEEDEYPVWDSDDELEELEALPGGTGDDPKAEKVLDLADFDLETILENAPELYKMERETAVKRLGFSREPVIIKEQHTGKQAIMRGDKYVAMVSPKYVVVPNEWIASGVEQAAEELGLVLHSDRSDVHRLFRYYLDEDNPAGPNGELQAGFLVRNSVDGSMSFSLSSFAFRQICTNGMVTQVDYGSVSFVHMRALERLDMGAMIEMIKGSVKNAQKDIRIMEQWTVPWEELPQGRMALGLLRTSRLPNTVKPAYLQEPNKRLKAEDIPKIPEGITFWEIYNEITDMISHNDITERTRVEYQGVLHKTLRPLLRGTAPIEA